MEDQRGITDLKQKAIVHHIDAGDRNITDDDDDFQDASSDLLLLGNHSFCSPKKLLVKPVAGFLRDRNIAAAADDDDDFQDASSDLLLLGNRSFCPPKKLLVKPVVGFLRDRNIAAADDDDDFQDASSDLLLLGNLSFCPPKKLLVIPVAGFLCHRVFKYKTNNFRIPRNRTPDSSMGPYNVYKRPHCEDFVKFCLERFHVGIWSSSKQANLDLDCLIGHDLQQKLLFTWHQEQCTQAKIESLAGESMPMPIFLKDLNNVFECPILKAANHNFSASNTLMICGDPRKALVNPPNTTISLEDYTVDKLSDNELGAGGKLRKYLDELSEADDVPSFVNANPIGNPCNLVYTPFYSKIVHLHGRK